MNTSQFDSNPDELDHWTPYSHWCAGCWHWVVDCEHVRDPLDAEHHAVDDPCIRSIAYHRATKCLEVRYRWKTIHQFRPVAVEEVRRIWKASPMSTAFDEVVKNRQVRFDEVRSEGKVLMSLLSGWKLLDRSQSF